ncbi:anhydro-N-acetylmuramic acid kinase, partial [Sulfitobacter sp. 15WGC]|uniref:anhydro-N-acetylmuramic acid kinase n=1 Tax=Sulfitobacter sp. 15WGC TaxID=2575437 RepID=UPI00113BB9B0
LDCPVAAVEEIGLDGDMLEAQAFAYLAVRVARGLPTSCPGTTGVRAPLAGAPSAGSEVSRALPNFDGKVPEKDFKAPACSRYAAISAG